MGGERGENDLKKYFHWQTQGELILNKEHTVKNNELLTGGEIAKILNISRAHAYALIQRGLIKHIKIGRLRRVRRSDLIEFIETRTKRDPFD